MLSLLIEHKAALFCLYPRIEHAAHMRQIAGRCRFVYSLALEPRRDPYRRGRKFCFASRMPQGDAVADRGGVAKASACPHPATGATRSLPAYQDWWADRAAAQAMPARLWLGLPLNGVTLISPSRFLVLAMS